MLFRINFDQVFCIAIFSIVIYNDQKKNDDLRRETVDPFPLAGFLVGKDQIAVIYYIFLNDSEKGETTMKKRSTVIWGIVLIAVGAVFALNALNITNINVFFDGWWTLFIIVPSAVGLVTEREKSGNLFGIAIGVFLLLCCRDIISFSMLWKLLVPAVIVIVGLKMVLNGLFGNKANEILAQKKQEGVETKVTCATFSGCDLNFDGEVFQGAELVAIFGGVKCDLRNAIIEKDCAIQVSAIFGGIDIFVPDHINVKVNSNCIFGGVSNKTAVQKEAPTLYISGICMFGGVEIK